MSRPPEPIPGEKRWTPERQLRFLEALARTGSVKLAAASAGMSREGAYRFRARSDGLFALLWDRAMQSAIVSQGHTGDLTNGHVMRLLGNHYRRESHEFASLAASSPEQHQR